MIDAYIADQIKSNFPHPPTLDQEKAIYSLAKFLTSRDSESAFILRGYAGTGKTSLVSALVRTMENLKQKAVLLAPTGRAAKVFSSYSDHPALTIHKRIYRQKKFTAELNNFQLNDNLAKHTLFIVDEASMISNEGFSGSSFGTGRLLDDLVSFVYSGEGCRLLLMGDTAQLPPVGEEEGTALATDNLRGYNLNVGEAELMQVVRQSETSGILYNATRLRQSMIEDDCFNPPIIKSTGFEDILPLSGTELIEAIGDSYNDVGMDQTIVITRSNKRANIYNKGIRNTILYYEDELCAGDVLMIAKNNYFWTKDCKEMEFIANGDMCVVRRMRHIRELYGFRFADVTLCFSDYDDQEIDTTILLDTLHSEAPALTREQNKLLFQGIMNDYADVSIQSERMKKLKNDIYYNALQIKYGYAITCHKAQGGQWQRVFLDQGYLSEDSITPDYYHWLYTAVTRATEHLYPINFPKDQLE